MATVAGVKDAQPEWFNPVQRLERRREARESIGGDVGNVFLALLKENKVPAWVMREVDIGQIKLAV